MSDDFPIAFVSSTSERARVRADTFVRILQSKKLSYKIKYRIPIEITIDFHHCYFMGEVTFRKWCMGRTYIEARSGYVCRSGRPLRKYSEVSNE